jgi:hypothetical protein
VVFITGILEPHTLHVNYRIFGGPNLDANLDANLCLWMPIWMPILIQRKIQSVTRRDSILIGKSVMIAYFSAFTQAKERFNGIGWFLLGERAVDANLDANFLGA